MNDSPAMSCAEAKKAIGPYLARAMSGDYKARFVEHIRNCQDCFDRLTAIEVQVHLVAGRAVDD